jgi:hypothetical protein
MVARSTPVKIIIRVENTTEDQIRLFFPTPHHFEIAIFRSHMVGQDEYVWPRPVISAQVIDVVKIPPRQTYTEVVTWSQVDIHDRPVDAGSYFVQVCCNADDFGVEGRERFVITG